MNFTDLNLPLTLRDALTKEEITCPTPVQLKAIPEVMKGENTYICSETGTGKTLAYLLPIMARLVAGDDSARKDEADGATREIDKSPDEKGDRSNTASGALQVVVITPTHELAVQVRDQVASLIQNASLEVRAQLLIGGASIKRQIQKLKDKPHIVIGSAGRILELIKMRKLKVHTVKSVVIDEADKLLYGDNLRETQSIIRSMMKGCQLIFASATMRSESMSIARGLSDNLVMINSDNLVNSDIEHFYVVAHENEKAETLRKLINALEPERALVFVHRIKNARAVTEQLAGRGKTVASIHGDCDKVLRQNTLRAFRKGSIQVLVSSDISARGLDVKGVTHVFSVDVPSSGKNYLHRAGRTGRAGCKGVSILVMTPEEVRLARRYQRELNIELREIVVKYGKVNLA